MAMFKWGVVGGPPIVNRNTKRKKQNKKLQKSIKKPTKIISKEPEVIEVIIEPEPKLNLIEEDEDIDIIEDKIEQEPEVIEDIEQSTKPKKLKDMNEEEKKEFYKARALKAAATRAAKKTTGAVEQE